MTRDRSLDVAVTGISARFPGCSDLDGWWAALMTGTVLTTRYDRHALRAAGVAEGLLDDPNYVPVRGHLADADRFDNTLFAFSPRDAELMDPQQRLMLEAAWTALEDAGVDPLGEDVVTGVYASATNSGYGRGLIAGGGVDPAFLEQVIHGTEPDFMASRIAYKLGLTGPAVNVQTACSSSLVAVHMAVQALQSGDCDQAVVVAAGVPFPQAGHLAMPGGVLSASGRCRPFDENADGVVAGSGVACVVLRRLADTLEEDGPEPYGVILGTAVNNDAAAKAGYYAPSVAGQEAVIRAALGAADVDASTVGYLEAHATGTRVGDPIEWSAASAAFGGMGARPGQVAVGALKANIGHLDAASGLASLIKAMFVVKTGVVPPVAGFTRVNPLLELDGSPLYIPTRAGPWTGPLPRRAAISSFGIGGTNAHVLVEQALPDGAGSRDAATTPADEGEPPWRLVLLSAADGEALTRSAARLADHLRRHDPDLADVSYTLSAGRAALPERLAVPGRTGAEVADRLARGVHVVRNRCAGGDPAPAVFAFPGQGAQYPGMAAPLAAALPGFAAALADCLDLIDACDPAIAGRVGDALWDAAFRRAELEATELAQPALFAVEYAAATALTELGLAPAAVVGHSLGEFAAACVAGIFDLATAARLVVARGRAMRACPPGAMLAVGCDEARAVELAARSGLDVELAAINAQDGCVVAGDADAVEAFRSWLGDKVFTKRLRTGRAFHSRLIEPALPLLADELAGIDPRPPAVPFAANATGRLVPAGAGIPADLFVEQARRPVRFADALAAIAGRFPGAVVVEAGPGGTLSAFAGAAGLTAVPLSPARTASPAEEVVAALGALWAQGQPVAAAVPAGAARRIHLPGYPFAGPRWIAPEAAPEAARRAPEPGAGPAAATAPDRNGAAQDAATEDGTPEDGTPVDGTSIPDTLAGLWAELLGHADLTEDSDFFQLGGDSLLITSLARKVNQELGVQVPIRAMLASRTLGRQTTMVLDLLERS
jgi:phthiocerol/phenolphthiocerol synthesis type-I polyketide synthase E